MLLTPQEVTQFITEIEKATLLEFKTGDRKSALSIYLALWDKLPEPKHQQPEQIANSLINCIFDNYFESKNYIQAKQWALKALNNDTAQDGAYEWLQMGQVCYELNELDDALKYFDIAYQRGKYRAFQEYDKKYWQFYSANKRN